MDQVELLMQVVTNLFYLDSDIEIKDPTPETTQFFEDFADFFGFLEETQNLS